MQVTLKEAARTEANLIAELSLLEQKVKNGLGSQEDENEIEERRAYLLEYQKFVDELEDFEKNSKATE